MAPISLWSQLRDSGVRRAVAFGLAGVILGVGGLAAFDFTLHVTGSDAFCLSCHELAVNIGPEYESTPHARNATGVRVTCSECHVPAALVPKLQRKVAGLRELYHHILGTIDTPEKFEAHRLTMAERVWGEMEENDSRECRACHGSGRWALAVQTARAREYHTSAEEGGATCIACHRGVAHSLPKELVPSREPPVAGPRSRDPEALPAPASPPKEESPG